MTERAFRGTASLEKLLIDLSDASQPLVHVGKLRWQDVEVTLGPTELGAEGVSVLGLRRDRKGQLAADSLHAHALTLRWPGAELRIDELEIESPRLKNRSTLLCSSVECEGLALTLDLPESPHSTSGTQKRSKRPDYAFLDQLRGHLNADLFVDLTGPLVGRQKETHEFRIPIASGSIDYEELEDDVNWLERSFLDIEVKDGRLVLERDIPLVPFTNKALLWWPLDAADLQLARRHRVRLRTLMNWQVPPKEKERRQKKGSIRFHQVEARKIDARLDLTGLSEVELGARGVLDFGAQGSGIHGLSLRGNLLFHRDAPSPNTVLQAELESLALATRELLLGSTRLSTASLHLEKLSEGRIHFDGLRPTALEAKASTLRSTKLRLALGQPSAS